MYPSSDKETRTERKKNKGKGSKGMQLEASDRHRMCTELQKYSHPVTSSSDHLYNTITGQVTVTDINKHQADALGTTVQKLNCVTSGRDPQHNLVEEDDHEEQKAQTAMGERHSRV